MGNLGNPAHLVPDLVRLESGHLVLDTTLGRNEPPDVNVKFVSLELRTGNAEDWDSYTLTCRIRFVEVRWARIRILYIGIRSSKGDLIW